MNAINLVLLMACGLSCSACLDRGKSNSSSLKLNHESMISVYDINNKVIIGKLGVPLGEPVNITATIFDGDLMRDKIHSSNYLLQVTHVNGKELNSLPIIEFSLEHASKVKLARDNFELYYIKNDKEAEELMSDQIAILKKEYVNKEVTLLVYETGKFTGMPSNLPEGADLWQDEGFCFKSVLEVLLEIEKHHTIPDK